MAIINTLEPTTVDITIQQGSDVQEFFKLWKDEAKTTPLDLTSFTAESMIRTTYDSRNPILTLSSALGTIVLGAKIVNGIIQNDSPANGGLVLYYHHEATSAIKITGDALEAVRDIELSDGVEVRNILKGNITILREVTR